jgi:hypothetical protein
MEQNAAHPDREGRGCAQHRPDLMLAHEGAIPRRGAVIREPEQTHGAQAVPRHLVE